MADFDFTQLKGRMAQAGKGGHVELSDLERNALITNAMDGGGGSVDPEEVQELIDESLEGYYNKFEVDSELNTKSDKADTYTLTFTIHSPVENGYLLHVDDETGVKGRFWTDPITVEFVHWEYTVQEW